MVRIKYRYLLLNILYPGQSATSKSSAPSTLSFYAPTPDHVDAGRFVTHLKTHLTLLFGDFGLGVSLSALKVVYFSAATSTAILRVPRNHHRIVWATLSHITELPGPAVRRGGGAGGGRGAGGSSAASAGIPCVIQVVRVSGTIRKAEEELIRRARRQVVRAKLTEGGGSAAKLLSSFTGRKTQSGSDTAVVDVSMRSIEDSSGGEEDDDDESD
ncbi:RNA-binding protein pop5 [Lithohypha guttulata]|uniref:RNA-binding protein pop5 n=1 Tax=Lithohypha guttulata TaxID=1690604 RepID=A0AAN7Y9M0_9EURO|nr:RNA-binding protein pop5 [Lithohypha guttulata]